jgi:hypothetical protein
MYCLAWAYNKMIMKFVYFFYNIENVIFNINLPFYLSCVFHLFIFFIRKWKRSSCFLFFYFYGKGLSALKRISLKLISVILMLGWWRYLIDKQWPWFHITNSVAHKKVLSVNILTVVLLPSLIDSFWVDEWVVM